MIYPDTGPGAAAFASARAGVDARVGLANAEGGIGGRELVYDWRDDQADPETNNVVARDLLRQADVFGIVATSIASSGSAAYLDEAGVPVAGLAADPSWAQHRNMFTFAYSTGGTIDTYGRFVASQGGSKAVLLQSVQSVNVNRRIETLAASMRAAGVEVAGVVAAARGSDSVQRAAGEIASSGADVVIAVSDTDLFAQIVQASRAAGASLKVALTVSGYDRQLLQAVGSTMAGVTIPLFVQPFEVGGQSFDRFRGAMARYAPQLQPSEQQFALFGYIAVDIFVRGFEAAGPCPTREAFIKALRSVTNYDAGGLISPIDFEASFGQPTTCYAFVRVNDAGTGFEVVEKHLCGSALPDPPPTTSAPTRSN